MGHIAYAFPLQSLVYTLFLLTLANPPAAYQIWWRHLEYLGYDAGQNTGNHTTTSTKNTAGKSYISH
jgi:hypothetical protein